MNIRSFDKINNVHYLEEEVRVKQLLEYLEPKYESIKPRIYQRAEEIVNYARNESRIVSPIESLLQEFQLNTKEGTVLLCLAEALLRIPDSKTIDRLLEDKFTSADWKKHAGIDKGIFVNASSWSFFTTNGWIGVGMNGSLFSKFSSVSDEIVSGRAIILEKFLLLSVAERTIDGIPNIEATIVP